MTPWWVLELVRTSMFAPLLFEGLSDTDLVAIKNGATAIVATATAEQERRANDD